MQEIFPTILLFYIEPTLFTGNYWCIYMLCCPAMLLTLSVMLICFLWQINHDDDDDDDDDDTFKTDTLYCVKSRGPVKTNTRRAFY